MNATADHRAVRDVVELEVAEAKDRTVTLLFDREHNLEERILREQHVPSKEFPLPALDR